MHVQGRRELPNGCRLKGDGPLGRRGDQTLDRVRDRAATQLQLQALSVLDPEEHGEHVVAGMGRAVR